MSEVVAETGASWNPIGEWLRRIEMLQWLS